MKKLLILLFSLFLLSSPSVFADDISDFEIEGISIGDSLLDYMTEDEILKEIERNLTLNDYSYLNEPHKYVEVYLRKDLSVFEFITFLIKHNSTSKYVTNKNDENEKYTILSVRGGITYLEDFNSCMQKRNEIDAELSVIFKNANRKEETTLSPNDPSGESFADQIIYNFKSGAIATIYCLDFEENLRIKNNWNEGLSIWIRTPEIVKWYKDRQ